MMKGDAAKGFLALVAEGIGCGGLGGCLGSAVAVAAILAATLATSIC